ADNTKSAINNKATLRVISCLLSFLRSAGRGTIPHFEPGIVILKSSGFCLPSTQAKFAASSELPAPVHLATLGYGQSGLVRTAPPSSLREAGISPGAMPFSTHFTSASKTPTG